MLTIGQLAAQAGVTVRAVRHYHRLGLLAEPGRDESGYRRYGAQAVIDLIRIKTLAQAGVPLARVDELLTAEPAEFAGAVAQIDRDLQQKIGELTRHRRRIAELADGEGLFLPPEITRILDDLRGLGVSEHVVRIERDAWILMVALSPELVPGWAARKSAELTDPDFRRLYLTCAEAFDWDAADPRLSALADEMVRWTAGHRADGPPVGRGPDAPAELPPAAALMSAQIASSSPAWRRLGRLASELT
jgi:DNA-binding transcriptional MerR regulator